MIEPEVPLAGGSHSRVLRVGETVRRISRPWSSSVHELLRHLDRERFAGAPRALGFDDQGREILTYIEGEVGRSDHFIPDQGGRFDIRLPDFVWRDDVLVHLGTLIRAYHDAAATFPWLGREWCYEPRQPVETVCHNEPFPQNTIFRSGVPKAFIDWDTATPGPRAWDLGVVAWRWVPFYRDEKCRAHGLPTGIGEKARRFRLLLDAYGLEPDIGIVAVGIERMREVLGHMQKLAADGSEHEVELARRGLLDEVAPRSRGWRSTRLRSSSHELSHAYRRVGARSLLRVPAGGHHDGAICRARTADESDHSRRSARLPMLSNTRRVALEPELSGFVVDEPTTVSAAITDVTKVLPAASSHS